MSWSNSSSLLGICSKLTNDSFDEFGDPFGGMMEPDMLNRRTSGVLKDVRYIASESSKFGVFSTRKLTQMARVMTPPRNTAGICIRSPK